MWPTHLPCVLCLIVAGCNASGHVPRRIVRRAQDANSKSSIAEKESEREKSQGSLNGATTHQENHNEVRNYVPTASTSQNSSAVEHTLQRHVNEDTFTLTTNFSSNQVQMPSKNRSIGNFVRTHLTYNGTKADSMFNKAGSLESSMGHDDGTTLLSRILRRRESIVKHHRTIHEQRVNSPKHERPSLSRTERKAHSIHHARHHHAVLLASGGELSNMEHTEDGSQFPVHEVSPSVAPTAFVVSSSGSVVSGSGGVALMPFDAEELAAINQVPTAPPTLAPVAAAAPVQTLAPLPVAATAAPPAQNSTTVQADDGGSGWLGSFFMLLLVVIVIGGALAFLLKWHNDKKKRRANERRASGESGKEKLLQPPTTKSSRKSSLRSSGTSEEDVARSGKAGSRNSAFLADGTGGESREPFEADMGRTYSYKKSKSISMAPPASEKPRASAVKFDSKFDSNQSNQTSDTDAMKPAQSMQSNYRGRRQMLTQGRTEPGEKRNSNRTRSESSPQAEDFEC